MIDVAFMLWALRGLFLFTPSTSPAMCIAWMLGGAALTIAARAER